MEGPHTEASKLLEAALEQMDGIIQGAKYEIPEFNANHVANGNIVPSRSRSGVSEALAGLREAILRAKDAELSVSDRDSARFVSTWLNKGESDRGGESEGNADELMELGERLARSEAEKERLKLQLETSAEQISRQQQQIAELEQLLGIKKELLRKMEQALDRERRSANGQGTAAATANAAAAAAAHSSELAHLRGRCEALEVENQELRKICSGNRTPKYLPIVGSPRSPGAGESSPDDAISGDTTRGRQPSPDVVSPTRSARGFKKIFGKIKRSNSGGHLEEIRRPVTPEFRRGGYRATAGGRLNARQQSQEARRRPVAEWNVDMICTWLECLGLGMYCGEVQKVIGTGEQLAKMNFSDLETKLNVKNFLHRKKLFLALTARQDPSRRDPEGGLDFQWVLRWLDDVGLPQYKDSFLEARVDGRVLNVLTVDDLFQLRVTNLLHHLSLRRGIQVLREQGFDPDCLKRRAVQGEPVGPDAAVLWTNHRVMEWLKQVDLSEYAPNLRGSGVHGALLVREPRFTEKVLAELLAIPISKSLLRRHLSIHFKELVGRDLMRDKRAKEQESGNATLSPTAKAKSVSRHGGQFTLKRKKSKLQFDQGDLLCPFECSQV